MESRRCFKRFFSWYSRIRTLDIFLWIWKGFVSFISVNENTYKIRLFEKTSYAEELINVLCSLSLISPIYSDYAFRLDLAVV